MASAPYRTIQPQPHLGIFTREQIDAAIRAGNAILARRERKKKANAATKKAQRSAGK
jgi:hypothetical protein